MSFRRATTPSLRDPIARVRAQRAREEGLTPVRESEVDPATQAIIDALPPISWRAADQVTVSGPARPIRPHRPLPVDERAHQSGGSGSTIPMGVDTRRWDWRRTG